MARSFTRRQDGIGQTIRAEHINELQVALEHDDVRIDGKANLDAGVPAGGLFGQVLMKRSGGDYDCAWEDVPGTIYPSLLLGPGGSFDRAGPVTVTPSGSVTVEDGVHGEAWKILGGEGGNNGFLSVDGGTDGRVSPVAGTILIRMTVLGGGTLSKYVLSIGSGSTGGIPVYGNQNDNVLRWYIRSVEGHRSDGPSITGAAVGAPGSIAIAWDKATLESRRWDGGVTDGNRAIPAVGTTFPVNGLQIGQSSQTMNMVVESIVFYPLRLSAGERERILALPEAWTMENAIAFRGPS